MMPALSQAKILLHRCVAAVSDRIEVFRLKRFLRLLRYGRKLRPIGPTSDRSCRLAVEAAADSRDALLDLRHAPLHLGAREFLSRLFTAWNLLPPIARWLA